MKKTHLLSLTLLSLLTLSACQSAKKAVPASSQASQISQSSSSSSSSSSSTSSATSSSSSSASSSSSSSSSTVTSTLEPALWTEAQSNQLRDYLLSTWGPSMGQVYQAYTPATQGNWYGVAIPDQLLEVPAGGLIPDFNGELLDLVWSSDGRVQAGQLGLVALYSDIDHVTHVLHMPAGAHLYLFTIDATGLGRVWISQQNQGNSERRFYFTETKNEDLRQFFAQLLSQEVTAVAEAQPSAATGPVGDSSVDTKNLTIEQSANWAAAHAAKRYGSPYTRADFLTSVTGIDRSPDGLVYVEVRENHNSANMRAAGADPNVAPIAGFYRINAFGELEVLDIHSNAYQVVETVYYE